MCGCGALEQGNDPAAPVVGRVHGSVCAAAYDGDAAGSCCASVVGLCVFFSITTSRGAVAAVVCWCFMS